MLDFSQSRQRASVTRNTNPAIQIQNEGAPLVADRTVSNGVTLGTGAAGEQFVGVSITTQRNPQTVPVYLSRPLTTASEFELPSAPAAGFEMKVFALNVATNAVYTQIAAGGTPTAGQFAQKASGSNVLVFPAGDASAVFVIGYRKDATVAEAQWLQGDQLPGANISDQLGTVGVITAGDVYTSEFDTSADWASAEGVAIDASGLFTAADAADALVGVRILASPAAGSPWLGISIGFNG